MGRAKPIELTSIKFEKQGEAIDFFKEMLNRYNDGEKINQKDSKILFELIQRHPDEKIGIGIDYFYRDKNPDQPTSCFHIMRINGEPTDFSYPKCVKGTKPSATDYYYRACRFAVSPYLTAIKNDLFSEGKVFCTTTGKEVTNKNSEYRHTEPAFKDIIDNFKVEKNIEISLDLFTEDRDMQYNVRFIDPKLSQAFIEYHKTHANLSIFSK